MPRKLSLLLLTAGWLFAAFLSAQVFPPGFYSTRYAAGFTRPLGMDFDDNGRAYVFEQGGRVFLVDTSGNRTSEPLIDISERVAEWHDHGLLGFCLDKDFLGNGHFYLLYAVDPYWEAWHDQAGYVADSSLLNAATWGRVVRFTADPATNYTTTLPDSRHVLLGAEPADGIPLHYNFHGLGKLVQADDGTLLLSTGDGASNSADIGDQADRNFIQDAIENGYMTPDQDVGSYRSQYLGSLQGKILRIDPETGAGLSSNPFYDPAAARSPQSRIWALGFRNPYQISLVPNTGSHDPQTGDPGRIYIGDVGNGGWEELNICDQAGQNFGWPHYEGPAWSWPFRSKDDVPNQLAPNPLAGQNGCPTYLGFKETYKVARYGTAATLVNPCDTRQQYEYLGNPEVTFPALTWSNANWNPPARAGTVGIGEDGYPSILSLEDPSSPIAGHNFDGYSSMVGFPLNLSGWPPQYQGKLFFFDFSGWIKTATIDANGYPTEIEPFGEDIGRILGLYQNPVTNKLYYLKQSHEIREIAFGGNPPPIAVAAAEPRFGPQSVTVNFDATASSDQNNSSDELTYSWDFADGTSATGIQPTHSFTTNSLEPTSFNVRLTVSDPQGAIAEDSLIISLNNTPPTVSISSFADGDRYPTDRTNLLELRADVTDNEHPIETLTYAWQTFLHHNEHFHAEPIDEASASRLFIEPLGCAGETYFFRVNLTVTDPAGLSTQVEQSIYPDCDPIPVATDLTATATPTHVDLDWQFTGPTDEILLMELQRAANFTEFTPLATVAINAAGPYSWRDEQPLVGNNVYRVKTITTDRSINYSNIAVSSWPKPASFSISPMPTDGPIVLEYNEPFMGGQLEFTLYDALGKKILFTNWQAVENADGFNKSLFLGNLPVGAYYYQLVGGNLDLSGTILFKSTP